MEFCIRKGLATRVFGKCPIYALGPLSKNLDACLYKMPITVVSQKLLPPSTVDVFRQVKVRFNFYFTI